LKSSPRSASVCSRLAGSQVMRTRLMYIRQPAPATALPRAT
jgi:hypothetical protein